MTTVRGPRSLALAGALAGVCALLGGCSSSSTPPARTSGSPSASASTRTGAQAAQTYLDAVNGLCDALLPKVIAVTNGGSLDIPLKDFFEQLPAHSKLRSDFDRDLARVPVPPAAQSKADVLKAYLDFADELDAKRLAAAKRGPDAYAAEVRAELRTAAGDPTITARNAAGFHDSCSAR